MRSKQCLNVCHLNSRFVWNKVLSLKDYTLDRDTDLFALTKTWLEPGDNDGVLIEELTPTGYKFLHNPRSSGRGGGIGFLFQKTLRIKQEETMKVTTFEYMQAICNTSTKSFRIVIIYRLPNCTTADFFLEFSKLLEGLSGFGSLPFVSGDFNFHMDQPESSCVSRFLCILKSLVSNSTSILLPTKVSICLTYWLLSYLILYVLVSTHTIQDYLIIMLHCVLPLSKPPREVQTIVYRKLHGRDMESFSMIFKLF